MLTKIIGCGKECISCSNEERRKVLEKNKINFEKHDL
jgi:bacterioferritin-associated ferredoxin